ncbi:MAG TPA: hypothetical protein VFX97_17020 [Pyrinomonadaceae bacterium]|nr:hypothetical protein [Pyrinomonadaceae bacterium]
MNAQLLRAADLAEAVLKGPEDSQPDALFDLIRFFCEIEDRDREDCAEAAQERIYPLTKHYRDGFEARRSA